MHLYNSVRIHQSSGVFNLEPDLQIFTPPRYRGAEYRDQPVCLCVCASVCVSVREHISGTAGPIITNFCAGPPWLSICFESLILAPRLFTPYTAWYCNLSTRANDSVVRRLDMSRSCSLAVRDWCQINNVLLNTDKSQLGDRTRPDRPAPRSLTSVEVAGMTLRHWSHLAPPLISDCHSTTTQLQCRGVILGVWGLWTPEDCKV